MEFSTLPENFREMRLLPYKKDFGYSYVFGLFPVIELADNLPSALFRIVTSSKLSESNRMLLAEKASKLSVPVNVDDRVIERLSPKENCFAIGIFRKFGAEKVAAENSHIVLVNPADKGNLGNIVRSAVAFGFKDIVLIGQSADLFDPHTVRASMGALFCIRPSHFDTFGDYLSVCGERDFFPFMLKGSPLETFEPNHAAELPFSLIFGNESSGLDDSFLSVGRPLRIAQTDQVDSLNLTVAAGIAMHWFRRQDAGQCE